MRTDTAHPLKAVFLFGPTASGKTQALQQWYKKLPQLEVISADSMQIYRGFNIGTAKPALSAPQHHLIDICNPNEKFTVADFVRLAEENLESILKRRGIPVVSGGSAFYFKHLWFGLPESPPADEEIRRALQERCVREGSEALRSELKRVDPVSYDRIQKNDTYRIIRSLEVYEISARPLSSYVVPAEPRSDLRILPIGIRQERRKLYEQINRRVETMFADGLVGEIQRLLRQGCAVDAPAFRAIGYREFLKADVLNFLCRSSENHSPENMPESMPENMSAELISQIQRASRNYAKRQITFFKQLPNVSWVEPDALPDIPDRIRKFFPHAIFKSA